MTNHTISVITGFRIKTSSVRYQRTECTENNVWSDQLVKTIKDDNVGSSIPTYYGMSYRDSSSPCIICG